MSESNKIPYWALRFILLTTFIAAALINVAYGQQFKEKKNEFIGIAAPSPSASPTAAPTPAVGLTPTTGPTPAAGLTPTTGPAPTAGLTPARQPTPESQPTPASEPSAAPAAELTPAMKVEQPYTPLPVPDPQPQPTIGPVFGPPIGALGKPGGEPDNDIDIANGDIPKDNPDIDIDPGDIPLNGVNPQTGDNTDARLWLLLIIASAIMLRQILFFNKKIKR